MVSINLPVLLANIVNFIIFFLLVKFLFYDKINAFMQSRAEEIQEEINEAEKMNADAEQYKSEYVEKLNAVEDEARNIIKDATKKGEEKKSQIIQAAEVEAGKMVERAKNDIVREKEKALQEVTTNIVDLSMYAAEKVIGVSLDKTKHQKMINDFIEEVGDAK